MTNNYKNRVTRYYYCWLMCLLLALGLFQGAYATTCPNATVINPAALPVNATVVCGSGNDITASNIVSVGTVSSSYLGGNEALYSFTPTSTSMYEIILNGQTYTSIFVFNGCPTTSGSTFVAGIGSSTSTKSVTPVLTAGVTYYILFDTWPTPNSPCPGTFTINQIVPNNATATANGGLWSSPATWVGGVVPNILSSVTIPAGSTVTVDQPLSFSNLVISGTMQWNATASTTNSLTLSGDLMINSGGKLFAYSTAASPVGAAINIAGNFTNDGYANLLLANITFNGNGSTFSGSGTIEGTATRGVIRQMNFSNLGSNTVNTVQPITVTSMALTAGSLNTNGKVEISNTPVFHGRPLNIQVSNVVVTNMGTTAYSTAPVVFGVAVTPYASGASASAGTYYYSGTNVYRCITAGTFNSTAPTSTANTSFSTSGPSLIYIGKLGTIGAPLPIGSTTTLVSGTVYFYDNRMYVATATSGPTSGPVHTSGTTSNLRYIGSPATVSVNFDAVTGTVRSLNLTSAGNGYTSATYPTIAFSAGAVGATGAGAAATAVVLYSVGTLTATAANIQKSGIATITGGLTINSDAGASLATTNPQSSTGVGAVFTANGGVNYTVAPQVGFAGPTALNLVTNPGSGYSAAPTINVTGGTLVSGSALTSSNFTITVAGGKLVSVYLNTGTTACYSVPPTLQILGLGSGATVAFPSGCWPTATANIGTNGQLTSFTVTNAGYGYVAAPTVGVGTTSGNAAGGTFTTAASSITAVLATYNLTLNFFTPAPSAQTQIDDAVIPTNRKMTNLTLAGAGSTGLKLSNNLTLYGTSPYTPTASAASVPSTLGYSNNVLDLSGNTLYFSWNGYGGTTSTLNQGGTQTYITNGSVTLTTRGNAGALNFPFRGTASSGAFQVVSQSGTGGQSDILTLTATELGAPNNSVSGGTAIALGKRTFRVNTTTVGAGGTSVPATLVTTPTVRLDYNAAVDSLTTTQDLTYVGEAPSINGPWTTRSNAAGTTNGAALAASGSITTATATPGPVTLANGSHFAFVTQAPTINAVSPTTVCAGSGVVNITGTNLDGVSSVSIAGSPVANFTIISSTAITATPSAAGTGTVSVVKFGSTFNGTVSVNVTSSPAAPTVTPASLTVVKGQSATLTANNGLGNTNLWYTQAFGGTPFNTTSDGQSLTIPVVCSTTTYYVSQTNGSCEGPRQAVTVTVVVPSISSNLTNNRICGSGGAAILTVAPYYPSLNYTWSTLTGSATFNNQSGATVGVNLTSSSAIMVKASVAGCPVPDSAIISMSVYSLPNATVIAPSGLCPGSPQVIQSGLIAGNFSSTPIPPAAAPAPANAVTLVSAGTLNVPLTSGSLDDGGWGSVPVGFNFNFFGTNYNTINVGTNGTLTFGTYNGSALADFTFTTLPSPSEPLNMIAVLAMDNNLAGLDGGAIRYWTEGYSPNRRFIVSYQGVKEFGDTKYSTARAIFYETIGTVEVYVDSTSNVDRNKLVGINNGNGTVGVLAYASGTVVSTNPQNPVTNPFAFRFTPPYNYNTTWFAFDANNPPPAGTVVNSGLNVFSITVNPTITTTYVISYTNTTTGCSNDTSLAGSRSTMQLYETSVPTGVSVVGPAFLCPDSTANLTLNFSTSSLGSGTTVGFTYQWQRSADNGVTWTNIAGATQNSLTGAVGGFQYRCRMVTCGNSGTSNSITIGTSPALNVTSPVVCGTSSAQVSVASAGSFTYSWTPVASNMFTDAGLTTPYTGGNVSSIYLQGNGGNTTSTLTLTATESGTGCVVNRPVSVRYQTISITSATAVPNPSCAGDTVQLSATTAAIGTGPQVQPTGYCAPGGSSTINDDEQIFGVSFASMSNLNQVENCGSNYGNYTSTIAPVTVSAGSSYPFTVVTDECDGPTYYSNGLSIYIDYNRDGDWDDANEQAYTTTATTSSPSTRTGTISIPANATAGLTRMRVAVIEFSTSPGACETFSYGEVEDYLVNIQGITNNDGSLAWSWTDGSSTISNNRRKKVTPLVSTTYTVTATDTVTGCSTAPFAVPVTVTPLPAAPTAVNNTRCGPGPANVSVTGGGGSLYSWYTQATGGTPLPNQTGASLNNVIINSDTTFYVASYNTTTGCLSQRTPVVQSYLTPVAISLSATPSATSLCLGSSVVLNVNAAGANSYQYSWTLNGTTLPVTGPSLTRTLSTVGQSVFTVLANEASTGCINSASWTINVPAPPSITAATATPSTSCAGSQVSLLATTTTIGTGPQTQPTGYCAPGGTSGFTGDEQIFGVSFAGMNNLTQGENCGSNYGDFTSSIAPVTITAGTSYPFTVVTDECDGGPYYSSGLAIYIDYNRDGDWDDAGEQAYTTTATTISPNTRSGNITIPASASPGVTRMRVVMIEAVPSPTACGTYSYGETEDYLVNILSAVQGTGALSWEWKNGSTTISNTNTATVNPVNTTTYTVLATDASGCTTTANVTVNVLPLPPLPIVTDNVRCGFGPVGVTVQATGITSPSFAWYNDAVGGTPIQSGTSTSLNGVSVAVDDTFYVAQVNPQTLCEGPRAMVIQEVISTDSISASSSASVICTGTTITLNAIAQAGGNFNYVYTWSSTSPGAGLNSTSGATVTATPTGTGTIVYNLQGVDGLCGAFASVSVAVNQTPIITKVSAVPDSACVGSTVTLTAQTGITSAGNASIGYPSTTTIGGSTGNPYRSGNGTGNQLRTQLLVTAAEMSAAGLLPGNIDALSFDVSSSTGTLSNFSISIAPTTATSLGTNFETGTFTQVFSVASFTPVTGINTHTFSTPFLWNGTSNILIDVCQTNSILGTNTIKTSNPGFIANNHNSGTTTGCTNTTGTTAATRPVIVLSGQIGTLSAGDYLWQWSGGTGSIPAGNIATINPTVSGTYTVVATDALSGCSKSASVPVSVVNITTPPVVDASVDTLCNIGNTVLSVVGPSSFLSYSWEASADSTGPWNLASFGNTFTVNGLNASTYFRATGSCGTIAVTSSPVRVVVNKPANPITQPADRCGAGNITVQALPNSSTGSAATQYNWYNASTGGTLLATNNIYTAFVTATTSFWVQGSLGSNCTTQRFQVNATVRTAPSITAITSNTNFCNGGSAVLTVSSTNANYSYSWSANGTLLGTGPSITVTPSSTTIYTAVASDSTGGIYNGCGSQDTALVNVFSLPVITSVTSNSPVACLGDSITLTATAVASGPQIQPTGYCANGGSTTTSDEQIFGVAFAGMNNLNQGENCSSNYGNYTSTILPITVNAGSTYPFTVVTNECDGPTYFSSGLSIYIDYNRDGDWNDAGEQAYTTTTTTISPNTRTGNITIPPSASVGLTRMRVVVIESIASPAACPSFSFGEVEDYLVNITGPSATYNWSTGQTGGSISVTPTADSTTYVVTATSAQGCNSAPDSITIVTTDLPEPVITTNDTTFCAPNEITIRVVDGGLFSSGYPAGTTFEWLGISPPIAGLDSISSTNGSTYSVVVTLPSGCKDTSALRNIVTRAVAVNETITSATCVGPNGSIIAAIASGSAPFTYTWSTDSAQANVVRTLTTSNLRDTLKGLSPGSYYVSIADSVGSAFGCFSGLLTYTVGGSNPIDASVTATDITCNGAANGSATVNWTGGSSPYNILWSSGESISSITVTAGGNLSVIISDGSGCADTASVTVTEPAPIQLTLSYTPASEPGVDDGTATVTVSGGNSPFSYDWIDANSNPYSGSTITNLAPGVYQSLVTDANNCQSTIESVTVGSNGRLTIKAFIEGFYDGAGGMYPVLLNLDPNANLNETDSISIALRDPLNVSTAVAGASTVIGTNGEASIIIPESVLSGDYYIAVSHRNAVETWSANPVTMNLLTSYDFTTAASQAYFDNMIDLGGVFAFFSGDLAPQDFVIDIFDQVAMDNDIANFNGGYIVTDLNGDGVADLFDQVLMDNNIANFIGSAQPF